MLGRITMKPVDQTHLYKTYKGEWVGLEKDQKTVIAAGKTLDEVLRKARKKGKEGPLVFKVPKDILLYVG